MRCLGLERNTKIDAAEDMKSRQASGDYSLVARREKRREKNRQSLRRGNILTCIMKIMNQWQVMLSAKVETVEIRQQKDDRCLSTEKQMLGRIQVWA